MTVPFVSELGLFRSVSTREGLYWPETGFLRIAGRATLSQARKCPGESPCTSFVGNAGGRGHAIARFGQGLSMPEIRHLPHRAATTVGTINKLQQAQPQCRRRAHNHSGPAQHCVPAHVLHAGCSRQGSEPGSPLPIPMGRGSSHAATPTGRNGAHRARVLTGVCAHMFQDHDVDKVGFIGRPTAYPKPRGAPGGTDRLEIRMGPAQSW